MDVTPLIFIADVEIDDNVALVRAAERYVFCIGIGTIEADFDEFKSSYVDVSVNGKAFEAYIAGVEILEREVSAVILGAEVEIDEGDYVSRLFCVTGLHCEGELIVCQAFLQHPQQASHNDRMKWRRQAMSDLL